MAKTEGGIATRNDVNTIVSGAYSDNLNKCVIVSEINSNTFVQIVASQVSLYSDATKCVQFSHIEPAGKTLSSIWIDPDPIIKVSGQVTSIVVWATYSDNTREDVTSLCTFSITNQSVNGVATWNSSSKTIQHGAVGTATFNASYTEGGITKTTSVNITTNSVKADGIILNPDNVTVGVGRSTTVTASILLNNGNTSTSGISIQYVNTGDSYVTASLNGNIITITGKAVTPHTQGGGYISVIGTYGGATITTQLVIAVVEAPTLSYIVASSTSVTGYNGGSTPVTITAYYSDGSSADVTTSTTGTSTNASYAAWNASGKRVQHNGTGSANITVSYTEGLTTKTCVISATTKTNGISHIVVSSSSQWLNSGGTSNITVTQVMLNGATSNVTSGASVTCNAYGSISKSGSTCTFTASSGSGISTITASFNGKTDTCIIMVGSPKIYIRSEIYTYNSTTAYLRIHYRTGIGSDVSYVDVSNYTWEVTSGPNGGHSYDGCKGTGPLTIGSGHDWSFVFYVTGNTTYWNEAGYYQGTNGTTLGAQNVLKMSSSWLPN